MDDTVGHMRTESKQQQASFFRLAKTRARETHAEGTLSAVRLSAGLAKRDGRNLLVSAKRAKKVAKVHVK